MGKVPHAVLAQLGQDGQIDWSQDCLHSVNVRTEEGGEVRGRTPRIAIS